MSNTHTPGPWRVEDVADMILAQLILSEDGKLIGTVESASVPFDELRANAKLISASPDLLESLEALLLYIDTYLPGQVDDELMETCDKATQKARGGTNV